MRQHIQFPFDICLLNIRSAFNVGAVFRTADGAGVRHLYLAGYTPYPPHNRIPKTALGAVEHVPWIQEKDYISLLENLKKQGKKIILAETLPNAQNLFEFEFPKDSVIVMGSEVEGLSEEVQKLADAAVVVPMFGYKGSLNVATTAGIVAYAAAAQFHGRGEYETLETITEHDQA